MEALFIFLQTIIPFFFLFVFGTIIYQIIRGLKQWNFNNRQPVLNVNAKLVTKRTHVSRNANVHQNHAHHHSSTSYFLTFEFDSMDRLEYKVSSREFGQFAEGDFGNLTFQGTRYMQFERWKH
jgi:hypothetical protein